MLTDLEIADLKRRFFYDELHTLEEMIREAVRLTAERCAEIADKYEYALNCAAAIRERSKDKPRPHFNPNEGFGPF